MYFLLSTSSDNFTFRDGSSSVKSRRDETRTIIPSAATAKVDWKSDLANRLIRLEIRHNRSKDLGSEYKRSLRILYFCQLLLQHVPLLELPLLLSVHPYHCCSNHHRLQIHWRWQPTPLVIWRVVWQAALTCSPEPHHYILAPNWMKITVIYFPPR